MKIHDIHNSARNANCRLQRDTLFSSFFFLHFVCLLFQRRLFFGLSTNDIVRFDFRSVCNFKIFLIILKWKEIKRKSKVNRCGVYSLYSMMMCGLLHIRHLPSVQYYIIVMWNEKRFNNKTNNAHRYWNGSQWSKTSGKG